MKKIVIVLITIKIYAAFPSWYYKIKNVDKQKKAFVSIMLPLIKKENQSILKLRKKIISIFNDPYFLIEPNKVIFLAKIASIYHIKELTNKKEFLKRVDIVPPSLALAQAAVESAWGKSRFAREANNLFGHWEYSNKGLKPKSRYKNIKIAYSIKIFPSIEASLRAYMLNLNRNRAYKEFRDLRKKIREQNKTLTGTKAAETLKRYSQKKELYVKLLQFIITSNNWEKYDK
ncbi:MAG: glucosaminidase domain-containing protein [Nautiliaceae bacterium]